MDLLIVGNVQTVIQGRVTQEGLHSVSMTKMPYALGGAAIPNRSKLSLGETIVYEGVGHIFTLDESYEDKKTLQAAFLMGIEKKPKEPFRVTEKQSIDALYRSLIKEYSSGFAIVGTALFSTLSVAYLNLSPIYGENINELHDKYWTKEELSNCEARLFGVVMAKGDPLAFYNNPNEKQKQMLASHTHVLTSVARHLLTDSELISGTFWIEEINRCKHF